MSMNCRQPARFVLAALIVSLVWPARGQEVAQGTTSLAQLRQRLTEHVSQSKFDAALWGVKIVLLETSNTVFEVNPGKLFSPASNSKLYTVALALNRLGADYRIKTSLYAGARPNADGVLEGDLIVYGRGDPTINARLHGNEILKALEPLVFALTNAGVKRIAGDLVGDASFFRGPELGSGWAWDDTEYYYGAEISALTINDNTLVASVKPGTNIGAAASVTFSPPTQWLTVSNRTRTVAKEGQRRISFYRPLGENVLYVTGEMPLESAAYTEDVTVHDPAGLFVSWFKEALARHGVEVTGRARSADWLSRESGPLDCAGQVELGGCESLPMRDIAREVQKPSQNLYTDLLLAHVGEKSRSSATPAGISSEELGIRELNRFLGEVGIGKGNVFFEEGSGLSRNNLTTPNATVALLQFMSRHASGNVYLQALPVAGVDGTLRSRMKGTAAEKNVRAKTGTLRWANSLSGYVTTAAGERLAFSLMLNRYHADATGPSARAELDAIAVLLAGCTAKLE